MGDSITGVLSLIIHDWNISHVWIELAGAGPAARLADIQRGILAECSFH